MSQEGTGISKEDLNRIQNGDLDIDFGILQTRADEVSTLAAEALAKKQAASQSEEMAKQAAETARRAKEEAQAAAFAVKNARRNVAEPGDEKGLKDPEGPGMPPAPPSTPNNGEEGEKGNGNCQMAVVALILATIALLIGLYLAANSPSKDDVGLVSRTANGAAKDASIAGAKADNALKKADEALRGVGVCLKNVTDLEQRVIPLEEKVHTHKVSPAKKSKKRLQSTVGSAQSHAIAPTGAVWLWHHYQATANDPKPCVIAFGNGAGLPPYCKGFTVQAKLGNESKHEWLKRVGGGGRPEDTGIYQKPSKTEGQ